MSTPSRALSAVAAELPSPADEVVELPTPSRARRVILSSLGLLSLGLGIVGAFLPLLPTVPFLLLAGWCFERANPALERWLYRHPRLGPPLIRWRRHGVIPLSAKFAAALVLGGSAALVGWRVESLPLKGVVLGVLACVALYVLSRPSRAAEEPAQ